MGMACFQLVRVLMSNYCLYADRGYIVSEGATNDGFALLRAKPAGDSGAVKGGAEGDRSGRDEKRKRKRKKKGSA